MPLATLDLHGCTNIQHTIIVAFKFTAYGHTFIWTVSKNLCIKLPWTTARTDFDVPILYFIHVAHNKLTPLEWRPSFGCY